MTKRNDTETAARAGRALVETESADAIRQRLVELFNKGVPEAISLNLMPDDYDHGTFLAVVRVSDEDGAEIENWWQRVSLLEPGRICIALTALDGLDPQIIPLRPSA